MTVKLDMQVVAKRMAERRMTGAALAKLIGISPQAFSAIRCRGTCSHINAALIADALGVKLEDIWKEV